MTPKPRRPYQQDCLTRIPEELQDGRGNAGGDAEDRKNGGVRPCGEGLAEHGAWRRLVRGQSDEFPALDGHQRRRGREEANLEIDNWISRSPVLQAGRSSRPSVVKALNRMAEIGTGMPDLFDFVQHAA